MDNVLFSEPSSSKCAGRMKAQGVRCIPESDIGLSILYCSVARYCNPRFTQSLMGSNSDLQSTEPVNVVCPNTEVTIPIVVELKMNSLYLKLFTYICKS